MVIGQYDTTMSLHWNDNQVLPESGSEGVVHDPHGQLHGAEEEAQEEHPRANLKFNYGIFTLYTRGNKVHLRN